MSLIKKSDVKSHLSTGSGTSAHLRDSVNQPEAASSEEKKAGANGSASTVAPGSKAEGKTPPATASDTTA
jgi:hypothetical protein